MTTLAYAAKSLIIGLCWYALIAETAEGKTLNIGPITVLLSSTIISIVSGLGHLLRTKKRSEEKVTSFDVVNYVINMGSVGAGMSMILYGIATWYYSNYPSDGVSFIIIGIVAVCSTMGIPFAEAFANFTIEKGRRLAESYLSDAGNEKKIDKDNED